MVIKGKRDLQKQVKIFSTICQSVRTKNTSHCFPSRSAAVNTTALHLPLSGLLVIEVAFLQHFPWTAV